MTAGGQLVRRAERDVTPFVYAGAGILTPALFAVAPTPAAMAALLAEKGIPSMSISVETYEGRVQLSGFVGSPDIVSRAGRVTATVSGVRTVHNNISVK